MVPNMPDGDSLQRQATIDVNVKNAKVVVSSRNNTTSQGETYTSFSYSTTSLALRAHLARLRGKLPCKIIACPVQKESEIREGH